MSIGHLDARRSADGRYTLKLDGQNLPHVQAFSVHRTVGQTPTVTDTFSATADLRELAD